MENSIGVHGGNSKLGKNISTFSRSVGPTCPDSCPHLDGICYAERIERIYKTARESYKKNITINEWQKFRSFLLETKRKGNVVRWHVAGDFLKTTIKENKIIDIKYINSLKKAYQSIIDDGNEPPLSFCYTHVYDKRVSQLSKYMKIFASVEDTRTYKLAKRAGFKLFAWTSDLKKGKDKNKIWISETGKTIVTCFEQLGTKNNCSECKFCFSPTVQLDIAFMRH